MNSAQTTDIKMSITTAALTHIHAVKTSARSFCKSNKQVGEGYNPATLRDSHKIYLYIKKKTGAFLAENAPEVEYDRDFWYKEGTNQGSRVDEPSHIAECGSDQIYDWFEWNQQFLSSVKEKVAKIRVLEVAPPVGEQSDTDSEMKFDADRY